MEKSRFRGYNDMIEADSEKHKNFVEDEDDNSYTIRADKLVPGEQIACSDDADMIMQKNDDGTVTLIKKSFTKNCFIQ